MNRLHVAVLAVTLAASGAASAQVIGYNVRTGDAWVDTRLGEINDYGRRYRDPFIDEMAGYYGAPRPLLVELLDQRRWAPADVYYACAMAHALRVPCIDIVHDYDRHRGEGWGALAKRRGIKPGSPAFHAMKNGTATTYRRWGYPVTVDRVVHVDWSEHGPHGKPRSAHASSSHDASPGRGNGDKGKGKNNNGKGNGNDKGHGKKGK